MEPDFSILRKTGHFYFALTARTHEFSDTSRWLWSECHAGDLAKSQCAQEVESW
jgi:hypothetical protein